MERAAIKTSLLNGDSYLSRSAPILLDSYIVDCNDAPAAMYGLDASAAWEI
jgi:hypothetical protein